MFFKFCYNILNRLDHWRDKRRGIHHVLRNINLDLTCPQKRILISYLDYRLIDNALDGTLTHTNIAECIQIIKIFIDMNFVIDICGHNCMDGFEDIKDVTYDYIFGMGEVFRKAVACNPDAYVIEYFTENPYWYSKQEEKKRNDYFFQRTGKKFELQRTGRYYYKSDEELADAIICMGNPQYFDQCNVPVYRIIPSALKNDKYVENFTCSKKNTFLVFGSEGVVHKGIDLLLEIFSKHLDWNLIVCGKTFKEECRALKINIPSNVHYYGFVDVGSQAFLDLCQLCGFIVLPSCSEGTSTAVETAMRHGLIPIVMSNMIIDEPKTYFYTFSGFYIDQIEDTLKEVLKLNAEEYQKLSREIYYYANEKYSLERYTDDFRKIMKNIIGNKNESSIS